MEAAPPEEKAPWELRRRRRPGPLAAIGRRLGRLDPALLRGLQLQMEQLQVKEGARRRVAPWYCLGVAMAAQRSAACKLMLELLPPFQLWPKPPFQLWPKPPFQLWPPPRDAMSPGSVGWRGGRRSRPRHHPPFSTGTRCSMAETQR